MKKKYWDQNTLLEDLYKRSPKLSLLMTSGKMFLEFILLEKNATTFLPFSFLWLSQLNIRRFFPNKYWCKCRFQGQTTFIRVYFSGISPSVETEAALSWCELSLDSCEVFLLGQFIGTWSWLADVGLAAFGGFLEELDGSLWRLLSSPEVDECLFLPNSSLIGGCKLWKTI